MSSMVGSRVSIHLPMLCAHPATSLPLIMVNVIDTLHMGDSNLVTPLFVQKYSNTSFRKSWALARLPVNI